MKILGKLVALIALLFISTTAYANLILNGDFENNSASSTMYNLSNPDFNATVANATAFGTANEIDLATGTDFGIAPQSGSWKLGIHTQDVQYGGYFDAFSLGLSSGIVNGNMYELEFYGAKHLSFQSDIQIGLSNSATDFGTLVFTAAALSLDAWTEFEYTFIAPASASFLTVRSGAPEAYSFVDNFSLEEGTSVPEPATILLLGLGLLGLAKARMKFKM